MEPTLVHAPSTHYAEIDVVFGYDAVEAWNKGARESRFLNELGRYVTKIFQTKEETLGYLAGLEDSANDDCLVVRTKFNP